MRKQKHHRDFILKGINAYLKKSKFVIQERNKVNRSAFQDWNGKVWRVVLVDRKTEKPFSDPTWVTRKVLDYQLDVIRDLVEYGMTSENGGEVIV